jgi:hypothetical protein
VLSDRFQRRDPILRVALDEIERMRREQLAQPRPRGRLVVGDQRLNSHAMESRW